MQTLIVHIKPTTLEKVIALINKLEKYDIVESVETRPTQLAPDACPYCLGKGEEPLNKVMVSCRFCAGTGKRG